MPLDRTLQVMQQMAINRTTKRSNLRPHTVLRQVRRGDEDEEPMDDNPMAIESDADDEEEQNEESDYVPSDVETAKQYQTPVNPKKRKRVIDVEDEPGPSKVRKPGPVNVPASKSRKRRRVIVEESSDSEIEEQNEMEHRDLLRAPKKASKKSRQTDSDPEGSPSEDDDAAEVPQRRALRADPIYVYKDYKKELKNPKDGARTWTWTKRKPKPPTKKPSLAHGWAVPEFPRWNPLRQFEYLYKDGFMVWLKYTNIRGRALFKDKWDVLRAPEAWRFLAVCFARGIQKSRTHRQVWCNDERVSNPWIKKQISYNRFIKIHRAIRCYDGQEAYDQGVGDPKSPNFDRLFKINKFLQAIIPKFSHLHNPSKELSLDESMCKCKGSCNFICVIPSKPVPKGIKLFVLACSKCAWVLNIIPYAGQSYDFTDELGPTGGYTFACITGENLLGRGRSFLRLGHEIYTDRYYTMLRPIELLLEYDTYYVGTIQKCRGLPGIITNENVPGKFRQTQVVQENGELKLLPVKMTRGDIKYLHTDKLSVCNWLDGGNCLMAWSLPHIVEDRETVYRNLRDPENALKWIIDAEFDAPMPAVMFNKNMGAVDLQNQYHSAVSFFWKCPRWYMTLFWKTTEICHAQCCIASRSINPKLSGIKFRLQLMTEIIQLADKLDPKIERPMTIAIAPMGKSHKQLPHVKCIDVQKHKPIQTHPGRLLKGTNIEMRRLRLNKSYLHFPAIATERGRCLAHSQRKDTQICCYCCQVRLCCGWCWFRWHNYVDYVWYDEDLGGPVGKLESPM